MAIVESAPQAVATTPRPSAGLRQSFQAITLEQALYLGIFVLSIISHLWALDNRALHHDETLHAAFSYYVMSGRGYIHDPLLHGPFLYFWGALIFFLFGDTNYTARLGAALFGSVLTVLPYLMRRELGRTAALFASVGLLISPVVLYVGRFIRHDIYAVTFELLVFICLVRYHSTRQVRWLWIGAAALSLMFTTLETSYLYVAIFVPVILGVFFYRVWRPGAAVIVGLAAMLALLVFILPGYPQRPFASSDTVERADGAYVCPSSANPFPPDNPMIVARPGLIFGLPPLATFDNAYGLCVRHQPDNDLGVYLIKLGQFFGHPSIIAAMLLTIGTLAGMYWWIWRRRVAEQPTLWDQARANSDSVLDAFASLGQDGRLRAALIIFLVPYTLLFTSFLTNPVGMISGTTGSLLYWLAQHEVERGGQPRHFYLVILNIYEPLMLFWALVGMGMLATALIKRWRGRGSDLDSEAPPEPSLALPLLLAWWLIGTLFLYSWAGEKMPWLTLHSALPLILFGSWAFARTMAWWRTPDPRAPLPPAAESTLLAIVLGIFGTIVVLCFLLITIALRVGGNALQALPWYPLVGLGLILLLLVGTTTLMGRRWALGAVALALTLTGAAYSLRSSFQLNFLWGDVPREMMIYTQTSPDVRRVIDRLAEADIRRGNGLDMLIWYDNETVWDWYMRRFTGAVEQPAGQIPQPPDNLMAMLLLDENMNDQNRLNLAGFRVQRFPLRWWFPEDAMYRLPADWQTRPVEAKSPLLMRILRTPFDGQTAADYWNYMIFRKLPAPLGSSDFQLVIRPELADEIGLGTGELK